jgi:hypothetical protein
MCSLGFTFWRENGQQLQDVCLDNVIEASEIRRPKDHVTMPEVSRGAAAVMSKPSMLPNM